MEEKLNNIKNKLAFYYGERNVKIEEYLYSYIITVNGHKKDFVYIINTTILNNNPVDEITKDIINGVEA